MRPTLDMAATPLADSVSGIGKKGQEALFRFGSRQGGRSFFSKQASEYSGARSAGVTFHQ